MSLKKLLPDVKLAVENAIVELAKTINQCNNTNEAQEQARVDELFGLGLIQIDLAQQVRNIADDIEALKAFLQNECVQSSKQPIYIEDPEKLLATLNDYDECWCEHDVWFYQNTLYHVSGKHTQSQQQLMILDMADKERQKFERLASKFSAEQSDSIKSDSIKYERTCIPENVRIEVWRRDQGRCAGCGSRESLEYDHIVPVSRGGSNTARNVELLCEACNRAKGDRIQ